VDCKVTRIKFMTCIYHAKGCGTLLATVATILRLFSAWEQCILRPFRHTSMGQLLCLMRLEAVKRAQAGFGEFLADSLMCRLEGKRDDNKEEYFVAKICNSAGHKYIDCEHYLLNYSMV